MIKKGRIGLLVILLLVTSAYLNHFDNGFHFDDAHTVENNPYVKSIRSLPRFFVDATTFSTLPDHQMYRPLVTATLAIDCWLGGGLKPFYFHLSTFLWFLVQLALMYVLFFKIMDLARPHPSNTYTALFAVAWYGLHPAGAETINYIVQRGDSLSTLGVVAGLAVYAVMPKSRRFGLYLIPAILGVLTKPSAIMFAPIFYFYVLFFEENGSLCFWQRQETPRWLRTLRKSIPALAVCALLYVFQDRMTSHAFSPGGTSLWRYLITQPFAALHYAKSLFLPTELSADADWELLENIFTDQAVLGIIFVVLMLYAALSASRRAETRPISFGIMWFFLALVPTSFIPFAEVMNDHRMFFPFVGLVLSVCWWAALHVIQRLKSLNPRKDRLALVPYLMLLTLPVYGYGTYQRNEVWHSEETLWYDVTVKSPHNGRGLMNYGLTQMAQGKYNNALSYFERARFFTPNYSILEINLGIVKGALGRDADAEQHFMRAISLAPNSSSPHFFYGRWLKSKGKLPEAAATLKIGLNKYERDFDSRYLLMEIYMQQKDWKSLKLLANQTLRFLPGDARALKLRELAEAGEKSEAH